MSIWKTRIKVIAINLVLICVLAEVTSLAGYAWFRSGLYYNRDSQAAADAEPIKVLDNVFHPFFGYVHRYYKPEDTSWAPGDHPHPGPEKSYWVNNFGFGIVSQLGGGKQDYDLYRRDGENCCDLPIVPGENELIVGVFGGSVARDVAMHARRFESLAESLRQYDAFQDKKITVINFAMGGYRQPQQLMILNYFLMFGQTFDVVLNVDGFNEVYHGMLNNQRGVDITYPAEDIWGQQQQHIERVNMRVTDQQGVQGLYHGMMSRRYGIDGERCTFAFCYVAYKLAARFHGYKEARINKDRGTEWEKVSHFSRKNPAPYIPSSGDDARSNDSDELYRKIAEYWGRSSKLMNGLAERSGALYVHVLQPNLHFQTARQHVPPSVNQWTPKFAEPVTKGYPALLEVVGDLEQDRIAIIDGTGIFDLREGDFYRDSCCHYNNPGTGIVIDAIARSIYENKERIRRLPRH